MSSLLLSQPPALPLRLLPALSTPSPPRHSQRELLDTKAIDAKLGYEKRFDRTGNGDVACSSYAAERVIACSMDHASRMDRGSHIGPCSWFSCCLQGRTSGTKRSGSESWGSRTATVTGWRKRSGGCVTTLQVGCSSTAARACCMSSTSSILDDKPGHVLWPWCSTEEISCHKARPTHRISPIFGAQACGLLGRHKPHQDDTPQG